MNKHQSSLDQWVVSVLRGAPFPPIKESAATNMATAIKRRRSQPARYALRGALALIGPGAIAGLFLFGRPTTSMAALTLTDVDRALSAVRDVSVTRRIATGTGDLYTATEMRSGKRWEFSVVGPGRKAVMSEMMDGSKTYQVAFVNKRIWVFVDGPTNAPHSLRTLPTPESFMSLPTSIFGGTVKANHVKAETNVAWNGRTVVRFSGDQQTALAGGTPISTLHRVLYVDPATRRPLELQVSALNSKLSETVTYDYHPLAETSFVADIPKDARVIDMPAERTAVRKALKRDGLIVLDEFHMAAVFLPDRPKIERAAKANHVRVRINQGPLSYTWPQPVTISDNGFVSPSRRWRQMVLYVQPPVTNEKTLSVGSLATIEVNGAKFRVPVMRVASTQLEFETACRWD